MILNVISYVSTILQYIAISLSHEWGHWIYVPHTDVQKKTTLTRFQAMWDPKLDAHVWAYNLSRKIVEPRKHRRMVQTP